MLVQNEVYPFGVKFNDHVKNSKLGSQISWTHKYKKKKKTIENLVQEKIVCFSIINKFFMFINCMYVHYIDQQIYKERLIWIHPIYSY